jgi:hypothetical protein
VRRWIPLALCLCAAGCGTRLADSGTLTVRDKSGKVVLRAAVRNLSRDRHDTRWSYSWEDPAGRSYELFLLPDDPVEVSGRLE